MSALDNSIVISDNFDKEIQMDTYTRDTIKLSSTMALYFCIAGEVKFRQGAREFTMRKDDVTFTRSGVLSQVTGMSSDVKYFMLITDEKFYFPTFNGKDVPDVQRVLAANPVCQLSESSIEECVMLYKLLKKRLQAGDDISLQKDIVRGYLQAIIFVVYSAYLSANGVCESGQVRPASRQQEIFDNFMKLMKENYTQERKIAWYADKLCVTPRYLSRIIRETSGHFASEYIDIFVISEAKHLLHSRKYTVLQVSEMLNFSSQSLFGRYFKNLTGYSPSDYQQLASHA